MNDDQKAEPESKVISGETFVPMHGHNSDTWVIGSPYFVPPLPGAKPDEFGFWHVYAQPLRENKFRVIMEGRGPSPRSSVGDVKTQIEKQPPLFDKPKTEFMVPNLGAAAAVRKILFSALQQVAISNGYVLMTRVLNNFEYLDLVAVPWTADAASEHALAQHIKMSCDGEYSQSGEENPHGRLYWWIAFTDDNSASHYIDLSVMPRIVKV